MEGSHGLCGYQTALMLGGCVRHFTSRSQIQVVSNVHALLTLVIAWMLDGLLSILTGELGRRHSMTRFFCTAYMLGMNLAHSLAVREMAFFSCVGNPSV